MPSDNKTMTFREGLIRARSHIVFILGLCGAFGLIIQLETWNLEANAFSPPAVLPGTQDIPIMAPHALTPTEREWAEQAWNYFERNLQPGTGLVNSADNYPASTLWDTGSYMMAAIAAERLGLIDRVEFDGRIAKLLESLARLPLYDGKLPNKSYNTISLAMVDYDNNPTERGLGWSAIDIARLMVPINIVLWNHPSQAEAVRRILSTWHMDEMLRNGELVGGMPTADGKTDYLQEGRLGYEQYSARAMLLMGYDATEAMRYDRHLRFVDIDGVAVPVDRRDPDQFGAHNYVVSEPYVLAGLEFGFDAWSRELAWSVFRAQERRFDKTGTVTAVSEDNIDQAPHFVYNTVFSDGKAWSAITDKGEDASAFRTLSAKAAVGWYSLYDTAYARRLGDAAAGLATSDRGWQSGRYEATGKPNKIITANTNAVILEALCYRSFGPLIKIGGTERAAR
jgi:hypothetical protein